jgi:hypothetical protein
MGTRKKPLRDDPLAFLPLPPVRLPVQHRQRPHCPKCGKNLPTFPSAAISLLACDLDGVDLVRTTITFRMRCECGEVHDIMKSSPEKTSG